MPYEAYIGYLSQKDAEIEALTPIVLEVRDLETYERKVVKALVGKPGSNVPEADTLWILDWVEARQEEPWRIAVLEELEEEDATSLRSDITESDLKAQAERSQQFAGGRGRGSGMPEMMGQEEARKFFENMQQIKSGGKR